MTDRMVIVAASSPSLAMFERPQITAPVPRKDTGPAPVGLAVPAEDAALRE